MCARIGWEVSMRTGLESGADGRCGRRALPAPRTGVRPSARSAPVLGLFRDNEDGFTSVSVALAILLSLTLVFSAAAAGWVGAKSSEVQRVADAGAMAGQNSVAAFCTVAQVLDACVLSMGLAGLVTLGAGLVLSCVPATVAAGAKMVEAAGKVLEARRDFSRSAAEGIQRLEATLPLLVVANSASCIAANSDGDPGYLGCAVPFPLESESDFSALEEEVDDAGMDDLADEMARESQRAKEAQERVDAAREKGWRADCGSEPYCLRERAGRLAGLSGAENPDYASADGWTFGAPLLRARRYYEARLAACAVAGADAEELTDAACRRAYYEFALGEVRAGSYEELDNGTVVADLPQLPKNAEETRQTALYTRGSWPCTQEAAGRTLHSAASCPGAAGAASGTASLSQLDSGAVQRCAVCQMDVGELGRVASASTTIDNGFEHHWAKVVQAAQEYEDAADELARAQEASRDLAERGSSAFSQAIKQLGVTRVKLCPPGAWGCVAVVARGEGEQAPAALTSAFLDSFELPAGVAVSAAALAPDESTGQNNVLASFFDRLSGSGSLVGGAADGVMELWGSLLVGYGSAYGGVADAGSGFLDKLDGVLGGSVGSWLKGRLSDVLHGAGLDPVDMRLRKPALTNSQDVLEKSGFSQGPLVRKLLQALPEAGSVGDYVRALGLVLVDEVASEKFTVATIRVPGVGLEVPLTIDLSGLGELT